MSHRPEALHLPIDFAHNPYNLIVRHNEKYWYKGQVVDCDLRSDPPRVKVTFPPYPPSDDLWLEYNSSRLATYDSKKFRSAGDYSYVQVGGSHKQATKHKAEQAAAPLSGGNISKGSKGGKGKEATPTSSISTRGRHPGAAAKGSKREVSQSGISRRVGRRGSKEPVQSPSPPQQQGQQGQEQGLQRGAEVGDAALEAPLIEAASAAPQQEQGGAGLEARQLPGEGSSERRGWPESNMQQGQQRDIADAGMAGVEEGGFSSRKEQQGQQEMDWEEQPEGANGVAAADVARPGALPNGISAAPSSWARAQPAGPFVEHYPSIAARHSARPFHTLAAAMLLHGALARCAQGGLGHITAWPLTAAFLRSVVAEDTVSRLQPVAAGYALAAQALAELNLDREAAAAAGGAAGEPASEMGSREASLPPAATAAADERAPPEESPPALPLDALAAATAEEVPSLDPYPLPIAAIQPQQQATTAAGVLASRAPAGQVPAEHALPAAAAMAARAAAAAAAPPQPERLVGARKRKPHPGEVAPMPALGQASRGRARAARGRSAETPQRPQQAGGNEGPPQRPNLRKRNRGPSVQQQQQPHYRLVHVAAGMGQHRPLSSFIMAPVIGRWGEKRPRTRRRSQTPQGEGPYPGGSGILSDSRLGSIPPSMARALMDLAQGPDQPASTEGILGVGPLGGAAGQGGWREGLGGAAELDSAWQRLAEERAELQRDQTEFRRLVNTFASLLLPPPGSTKPSPLLEAMAADPEVQAKLHSLLSKVLGLDNKGAASQQLPPAVHSAQRGPAQHQYQRALPLQPPPPLPAARYAAAEGPAPPAPGGLVPAAGVGAHWAPDRIGGPLPRPSSTGAGPGPHPAGVYRQDPDPRAQRPVGPGYGPPPMHQQQQWPQLSGYANGAPPQHMSQYPRAPTAGVPPRRPPPLPVQPYATRGTLAAVAAAATATGASTIAPAGAGGAHGVPMYQRPPGLPQQPPGALRPAGVPPSMGPAGGVPTNNHAMAGPGPQARWPQQQQGPPGARYPPAPVPQQAQQQAPAYPQQPPQQAQQGYSPQHAYPHARPPAAQPVGYPRTQYAPAGQYRPPGGLQYPAGQYSLRPPPGPGAFAAPPQQAQRQEPAPQQACQQGPVPAPAPAPAPSRFPGREALSSLVNQQQEIGDSIKQQLLQALQGLAPLVSEQAKGGGGEPPGAAAAGGGSASRVSAVLQKLQEDLAAAHAAQQAQYSGSAQQAQHAPTQGAAARQNSGGLRGGGEYGSPPQQQPGAQLPPNAWQLTHQAPGHMEGGPSPPAEYGERRGMLQEALARLPISETLAQEVSLVMAAYEASRKAEPTGTGEPGGGQAYPNGNPPSQTSPAHAHQARVSTQQQAQQAPYGGQAYYERPPSAGSSPPKRPRLLGPDSAGRPSPPSALPAPAAAATAASHAVGQLGSGAADHGPPSSPRCGPAAARSSPQPTLSQLMTRGPVPLPVGPQAQQGPLLISVAQAMQKVMASQVVHKHLPSIRTGSGTPLGNVSPTPAPASGPSSNAQQQPVQQRQPEREHSAPASGRLSLMQALARLHSPQQAQQLQQASLEAASAAIPQQAQQTAPHTAPEGDPLGTASAAALPGSPSQETVSVDHTGGPAGAAGAAAGGGIASREVQEDASSGWPAVPAGHAGAGIVEGTGVEQQAPTAPAARAAAGQALLPWGGTVKEVLALAPADAAAATLGLALQALPGAEQAPAPAAAPGTALAAVEVPPAAVGVGGSDGDVALADDVVPVGGFSDGAALEDAGALAAGGEEVAGMTRGETHPQGGSCGTDRAVAGHAGEQLGVSCMLGDVDGAPTPSAGPSALPASGGESDW